MRELVWQGGLRRGGGRIYVLLNFAGHMLSTASCASTIRGSVLTTVLGLLTIHLRGALGKVTTLLTKMTLADSAISCSFEPGPAGPAECIYVVILPVFYAAYPIPEHHDTMTPVEH